MPLPPRDHLLRALAPAAGIRLFAAVTTLASRKARDGHRCAPTSAALLAQGLTAGALLASALEKGYGAAAPHLEGKPPGGPHEPPSETTAARVNLQVACDGPAGGLFIDAGTDGALRGYVKNPGVFFPSGPDEPLAPERALGRKGYVSVLRDMGGGEIYRGMVELEACDLAIDLERYFQVSEQVETAVGLSVLPAGSEPLGQVAGVLAQRLPGGDASAVDEARAILRSGGLDKALRDGRSGGGLFESLGLGGSALELLADLPLEFRCRCSRERAIRAVLAMGLEEMRSLFAEIGEASLTCEFCGARYHVPGPELLELIRAADQGSESA